MAQWLFDRHGQPQVIHDGDCFRDNRGRVIAWIRGNNVHTLTGSHIGWFEQGVLFDSKNGALGFLANATGHLPSRPGLSGTPGMPGFSGRPGTPGLSGAPGRPGYGGWSSEELGAYFSKA